MSDENINKKKHTTEGTTSFLHLANKVSVPNAHVRFGECRSHDSEVLLFAPCGKVRFFL